MENSSPKSVEDCNKKNMPSNDMQHRQQNDMPKMVPPKNMPKPNSK